MTWVMPSRLAKRSWPSTTPCSANWPSERRGRPAEAVRLTEAMLLLIHACQVKRCGGAHGILEGNVRSSALPRPGTDGYSIPVPASRI